MNPLHYACRALALFPLALLACAAMVFACAPRPHEPGKRAASDTGSADPNRGRSIDSPVQTRVMTFNIRYAGGDKGEHAWANRRNAVAQCINAADPDILGLQEVEAVQADWLRESFPHYAFHGVGRIDGVRKGEFAPILYRADRYEPQDSGHFWISTTPDVPGSKSWNTACERMASWVRLRDRASKHELLVINTHLDHVSAQAREQGVKMIRERAEQLPRQPDATHIPVIITGDFNTSADGPLGVHLCSGDSAPDAAGFALRDAYRVGDPTADGDEATFNAWTPRTDGDRIDWIFATPSFDVVSVTIDRHMPEGVLPSDHYPVIATLRTPPNTSAN